MNKRANGSVSIAWADMVATYRDQLSGIVLVPTSTIVGSSSIVTETGITESMGGPHSNRVGETASMSQTASSISSSTVHP